MINGTSLTQQPDEHDEIQPGLVKSVGCFACFARHFSPFTRACRGPHPLLIAA